MMSRLGKLLICAAGACLFGSGCGGGSNEGGGPFVLDACGSIGLKVINGTPCSLDSSVPGSPIVRLRNKDAAGQDSLCTGAVLTPNAVLTAGHCFLNGSSELWIDSVFESVSAASIQVHPGFDPRPSLQAVFNDAAVVFTAQPLSVPVFPILTSRSAVEGEEGVVAGVGQNDQQEFGALEAGNTRVSSVNANHIFTEFNGEGSNPCFGDSGGPLLLNAGSSLAVAGIVSSGNPDVENCGVGDVTLYASVANSSVQSFVLSLVPGAQQR